jgi:predicted Zn finger-like uncharacterized protein
MIIQCENCSRKFVVRDKDIPSEGRTVQCGYCSVMWKQRPIVSKSKTPEPNIHESLSVESIKASDGKSYKFMGTQWVMLFPSGKTGLFAKKKIGKELDKITGRKVTSITKRKTKKNKEVNPSSEVISGNNQLPEIYKPKEGLGFFGYIFLIIIIIFSIIGGLKTFEADLINYSPEIELIYTLLDEQLAYVSESIKNIIVIAKDLLASY